MQSAAVSSRRQKGNVIERRGRQGAKGCRESEQMLHMASSFEAISEGRGEKGKTGKGRLATPRLTVGHE